MKAKQNQLDNHIRSRVNALVSELTNTIRMATLEAVHNALGSTMAATMPTTTTTTTVARTTTKKARNGTRTPEQVAKTGELFAAYVKKHQGQRLEQIAKGLGVSTRDLTYPVGKLLEAKKLTTKGQARGRKYFAK